MPFDPHNPSPNVRALKAWIDGLDKWDLDLVMEPMDETLIHEVLPASLGKLVRNRTEYKEYFGSAMKLFASFSVTIDEVVESPDKVAFHANSVGKSVFGTPYANEYACFLTFVDSPEGNGKRKISKIREFVDSTFSKGFFEGERAKAAAHAAGKA